MSLHTQFSALEIGSVPQRNTRRLSGLHRALKTLKKDSSNKPEQEDSDSISSGKSSPVDLPEMEQNNENTKENTINVDPAALRRSGRKRTSPKDAALSSASTMKTAKLHLDPEAELDYLKSIYLDKSVKLKHNSLETIFEDPKVGVSKGSIMSGRKFRRYISFEDTATNNTRKTKRRTLKAKVVTSKTRSRSKLHLKMSDLTL